MAVVAHIRVINEELWNWQRQKCEIQNQWRGLLTDIGGGVEGIKMGRASFKEQLGELEVIAVSRRITIY